ncbi:hypothetical protein STRAU_7101 [Streptomyces aurantiacus JA 4570]|uniref:Uncharacterized protein n=1 Tax=Streptomyces aurantiacus JA 4570 TaxID=1286094 RepID=S3ZNG2_9ACTN|nr:hypothetical protein STRAU_7101 [Streptomyces aurantiacus JA 4570]
MCPGRAGAGRGKTKRPPPLAFPQAGGGLLHVAAPGFEPGKAEPADLQSLSEAESETPLTCTDADASAVPTLARPRVVHSQATIPHPDRERGYPQAPARLQDQSYGVDHGGAMQHSKTHKEWPAGTRRLLTHGWRAQHPLH